MEQSLHKKTEDFKVLQKKFTEAEKENRSLEKKYENIVKKATSLGKELKDEKHLNQCLRENQVFLYRNQVFFCFVGGRASKLSIKKIVRASFF